MPRVLANGRQRAWKALRLDRSLTRGEMFVALAGLALVGLLALGPRIHHGGFNLDDWSNATLALGPPGSPNLAHAVSGFANFIPYRPVLVVYLPLTYLIFGMHSQYHLAWAAFLSVAAATMFYGVLRSLDVPWTHAALIAALTIVFPWSDATRLWATAGLVDVSIVFMFAGMLVALQGLRRSWRWHVFASLLYLLSILSYEITLPLVVCVGFLYWLRAGWQAAKWRWLADLAAAAAGALWVWSHTPQTTSGLSEDLTHLGEIIKAGGMLVGRAGYPLGSAETTPVLIAIAVVLCLGFCARFGFADRFRSRAGWGLQQWLGLTVAGLVLTALGWVMLIPAYRYYYTPAVHGEVNRINGLAAFGMVVAVYGSFGIVGSMVGQLRTRGRLLATATTVLLGVTLMASYTHVLRRHIALWNASYDAEMVAMERTKQAFPRLPPGTTVFASSFPQNEAPGVTILATTWDYLSMLRIEYGDSSIFGVPLLYYLQLACQPEAVVLEREGLVEVSAPYGTARLFDLETGAYSDPKSQRECKRVAGSYVQGPMYLSETY